MEATKQKIELKHEWPGLEGAGDWLREICWSADNAGEWCQAVPGPGKVGPAGPGPVST